MVLGRLTPARSAGAAGVAAQPLHGQVAGDEQQRRQEDLSHGGHVAQASTSSVLDAADGVNVPQLVVLASPRQAPQATVPM